ncbi:MAG: hypothetical protein COB24_12685 [Hyphomicrobiales bacterium]|nr:MAG: hypothetical protein COB24_12685 [Hyphomicrobiales bacterium]
MNKHELKTICDKAIKVIPKNTNGADKADLLVLFAVELGLTHLLVAEARPDKEWYFDLPEKAPELYQARNDKRERPHVFIQRVYKKWLGKGLAQHHVLHLDKPLYYAFHNWRRHNDMPNELDLPSKEQVNDRELADLDSDNLPYPSYSNALKNKIRLYNAARNRKNLQTK